MKGMIKCPHCDFTEDSEKFYYSYEEQGRLYTCINCNNSFLFVPKERIDYMSVCESCGRHILKNASHWRGPYILCFTCVVPFDVKFETPRPKGAGILTSLTGTCSGVVAKTEDPISVSVNSGAPSPTNRVEVALSAADNLIVNSCRQKYLKDCEESDVEIHPRPKDRGFLSPRSL